MSGYTPETKTIGGALLAYPDMAPGTRSSDPRNGAHTQCLVLNASYEPLAVVPVPRAVQLLFDGRAQAIEADSDRPIRSVRTSIPRPLVVRLTRYVKIPPRIRRRVTNILLFARDGYRCAYCGTHQRDLKGPREFLTRDHIIPQSRCPAKEEADTWENVCAACEKCNGRKANQTPEEAGMVLRIVPRAPRIVLLEWKVRRLTELQRKWVVYFFGDEVLGSLEEEGLPRG